LPCGVQTIEFAAQRRPHVLPLYQDCTTCQCVCFYCS